MRYYRVIYRRRPAVRAYNRPPGTAEPYVRAGTARVREWRPRVYVTTRASPAISHSTSARRGRTLRVATKLPNAKQFKSNIPLIVRLAAITRAVLLLRLLFSFFISHLLMQLHSSSADCIIFYVVILVFIGFVRK